MLIGLIVIIVLIGVCAAMLPMPQTVRNLLIAAAVVLFVVWLLSVLGLLPIGGVERPVVITR